MTTNMQDLRREFMRLEGFKEPLKEMRRQLQSEIAAHDEKTGD